LCISCSIPSSFRLIGYLALVFLPATPTEECCMGQMKVNGRVHGPCCFLTFGRIGVQLYKKAGNQYCRAKRTAVRSNGPGPILTCVQRIFNRPRGSLVSTLLLLLLFEEHLLLPRCKPMKIRVPGPLGLLDRLSQPGGVSVQSNGTHFLRMNIKIWDRSSVQSLKIKPTIWRT